MIYWQLFYTFFQIGLFGFGGGMAIFSLIQMEVVGHGWLTPEEIVDTLANITQPYCVIKTEYSRYEILATTVSHFGEPLLVIVEVGSGLGTNPKANINKLITIYPKSDIDKTIEKTDKKYVLYIKK